MKAHIRPIQKKDNTAIKRIIKKVIIDFGVPKKGTAYEDVALENMYAAYQFPNAAYFVLEINEKIVGGAGIGPLKNEKEKICELQKMYFLEEARGKGFGKEIILICLKKAKELGYKHCYLETMPHMKSAQWMYKKMNFKYINSPMGNTGHSACQVYMLKAL